MLRLQGVRHGPVVYRPYKRGTPVSPPLLLLLLLLPLLAVAAHIATLPSVAAFPSAAALPLHFPGPRINNLYCMRPRRRNCWAKFGCSRTRCVCSGHSSWRRHRGIWSSIFDWCSWVGPNNIHDILAGTTVVATTRCACPIMLARVIVAASWSVGAVGAAPTTLACAFVVATTRYPRPIILARADLRAVGTLPPARTRTVVVATTCRARRAVLTWLSIAAGAYGTVLISPAWIAGARVVARCHNANKWNRTMWMGRIVEWNNGSAARLEKASLGDPEYEGRAHVAPRAGFVALCFELCFLAIWQSHCGMGDVAPINKYRSFAAAWRNPPSQLPHHSVCMSHHSGKSDRHSQCLARSRRPSIRSHRRNNALARRDNTASRVFSSAIVDCRWWLSCMVRAYYICIWSVRALSTNLPKSQVSSLSGLWTAQVSSLKSQVFVSFFCFFFIS